MKKLINRVAFLFLIGTALIGCEKEPIEVNIMSKIESENTSLISGKNTSVFDMYGISHNLAMDYVATHPDFDNLSKEEIFNHLHTYEGPNFNFTDTQTWPELENGLSYTETLFSDLPNAGKKLYIDGFIESEMVDLAQVFFNVFDDAVLEDDTAITSVEDFIVSMESFEDYVNSNYDIIYNETTKEGNFPALLLAAASVAKNSYAYWDEVGNNDDHPWAIQNANRGGNTGRRSWFGRAWHSIKVAAVDVGGFFGGGGQWSDKGFNFGLAWRHAGEQSSSY
jgi:hypothetical protein